MNIENEIKRLETMPNSKKKAIELDKFREHLIFLFYSSQITDKEYTHYSDIFNKISGCESFLKKQETEYYNLFIKNYIANGYLNSLYENILTYAQQFPIFNVFAPNYNFDKLIKLAEDFFKWLGDDVYKLYLNMKDKNQINFNKLEDYGGAMFDFDDNCPGIIIDTKTTKMYQVCGSLVHEVGHTYHNYLNRNHRTLARDIITQESISKTFEELFLIYLRENHLLNTDTLDQFERRNYYGDLVDMNSVYVANTMILQSDIVPYISPFNFTIKIPTKDFQDLSIIKPKAVLKQLENKANCLVKYYYNAYAFGFIVSKMARKFYYSGDEKTAMNFIKHFAYLEREYPSYEILEILNDDNFIEAVNEDTKRVLSKTYYKE